ncbi:MAG: single-stranded-DNA-specific exonuclease RecJ [Chitinophagales bacterium]|nr:single-stranded-DNA-specific exonuclease RecJ [Chitinophagales bacterium]
MEIQKKSWNIQQVDEELVRTLQLQLKIHPKICRILVARGITTFEDAKHFFRPSLTHLHDPFLMKDMEVAVNRILQAFEKKEKILVFGDYDVDGTTAVSLMYSFLKTVYEDIGYYIPDRYREGYGISMEGIDFAKENGFTLMIALDCGIKAHDKVEYANALGVDFIICDHHLPGITLPAAVAVLDQKRTDCTYPYKELSGCGIGFKLAQALAMRMKLDMSEVYTYLDLVAVSIASDIVPITGENRTLAYFGLQKINANPRPGLKALLDIAQVKERILDISDLVFIIGPRINAAGRIAHGSEAVDLLIETDATLAKEKAEKIQLNNDTRKEEDKSTTEEALEMLRNEQTTIDKKSTVLFQPHWHKGVIGIVASRLIEKYYKPTIILTESNGMLSGSARSVHDFDVYEAIQACAEHLNQFGGHKYAAGLTLLPDKLPHFIEQFEVIVSANITEDQLQPKVDVDGILELSDITPAFLKIIEQMAPFGPGNMRPVWMTMAVQDNGRTRILKEDHLKLEVFKVGQPAVSGIGFNMKYYFDFIKDKRHFDICYQLYENEWNGHVNVELRLKDIR